MHVEDIARAYVAALEAPQELVHGRAFNVGQTSENYRVNEVAAIVEGIVPNCEIQFAADGGPDKRCYRVDCNQISRTLHSFKPQWTVERGVRQLYDAYIEAGLSLEDFEGVRFQRIAHVMHLMFHRPQHWHMLDAGPHGIAKLTISDILFGLLLVP